MRSNGWSATASDRRNLDEESGQGLMDQATSVHAPLSLFSCVATHYKNSLRLMRLRVRQSYRFYFPISNPPLPIPNLPPLAPGRECQILAAGPKGSNYDKLDPATLGRAWVEFAYTWRC